MTFTRLRATVLLAVAVMAMAALTACGGGDSDSAKAGSNSNNSNGAATTPAGSSNSSKEAVTIEVDMGDNFFEPKEITVDAGAPVTFTVKNTGTAIHNMNILSQEGEGKNYMSDALVQPGGEDSFEVTFSKPGTYEFQCDYHVPDMVGTITVK